MKKTALKCLEIGIESVNYIIIDYALSNMTMMFQSNPLFILFFASKVWLIGYYWRRIRDLTGSRILSAALLIACFAIHIGMLYWIGREAA